MNIYDNCFAERGDQVTVELKIGPNRTEVCQGQIIVKYGIPTDPCMILNTEGYQDKPTRDWYPYQPYGPFARQEEPNFLFVPWSLIVSVKKIGMNLEPVIIVDPDIP